MATYKKYKYYKQQVFSGGTWVDVIPYVYTLSGDSYGSYNSLDDCLNSITPTTDFKLMLIDNDKPPYRLECNSSQTLNVYDEVYRDMLSKGLNNFSYQNGSGYVGNCVTTIYNSVGEAFNEWPHTKYFVISDSVTTINGSLFKGDGNIKQVKLPSGLTSMYEGLFASCTGLTSIDIPSGVTSIGNRVFYYCKSLTSIDIPSGVTSIGHSAFTNCSGLTSINIPSGVTWIGDYTFKNCRSIKWINIPSGVTIIGIDAFYNCNGLASIIVNATTPPMLFPNSDGYATCFDGTNNCPIYVPTASVNAYKTANRWTKYADRIRAIP